MNFAIFFLCEIEIKYGNIQRKLINYLLENPEIKLILQEKIVKNNKFK